jgi:hypothetical protein
MRVRCYSISSRYGDLELCSAVGAHSEQRESDCSVGMPREDLRIVKTVSAGEYTGGKTKTVAVVAIYNDAIKGMWTTYQGMPHTAGEAFVVVLVATCGMSGAVGIFCVWHVGQGRVHFSTMPRSSHHRPSPLPIVPGAAAAASSLRP